MVLLKYIPRVINEDDTCFVLYFRVVLVLVSGSSTEFSGATMFWHVCISSISRGAECIGGYSHSAVVFDS